MLFVVVVNVVTIVMKFYSFIFSSLTSGIVVGLQVEGFGALGWMYFVAFWLMWEVGPRKEEFTPPLSADRGCFAAALIWWRQSGIVIGLNPDWGFVKSGQWCTMSWIFTLWNGFYRCIWSYPIIKLMFLRFLTLDVNVKAVTAAEVRPLVLQVEAVDVHASSGGQLSGSLFVINRPWSSRFTMKWFERLPVDGVGVGPVQD